MNIKGKIQYIFELEEDTVLYDGRPFERQLKLAAVPWNCGMMLEILIIDVNGEDAHQVGKFYIYDKDTEYAFVIGALGTCNVNQYTVKLAHDLFVALVLYSELFIKFCPKTHNRLSQIYKEK